MRIPLDPFAEGITAPRFNLIAEEGQGYLELVVADENDQPLAPRLRIENHNGILRLFVWDARGQLMAGPHSPPYSQSIILACAEPSAVKRLFGLQLPSALERGSLVQAAA